MVLGAFACAGLTIGKGGSGNPALANDEKLGKNVPLLLDLN